MAHVWRRSEDIHGAIWSADPLDERGTRLAHPRSAPDAGTATLSGASIACASGDEANGRWVLVAGASGVRINGRRPLGGLAVLRDRDEIAWPDGTRAYFSAEVLPAIVPYPDAKPVKCPSCYEPVAPGQPAVRCACGVWYHQGERACFTFIETCRTCSRRTALDGRFEWNPESFAELCS